MTNKSHTNRTLKSKKVKTQRTRHAPAARHQWASALDAAAKVLHRTGKRMTCPELITAMAEQGLWTSPKGKRPQATLYAALLREIDDKGTEARFEKVGAGL